MKVTSEKHQHFKKKSICLLSCARPQLQYVEPSTLSTGHTQAPCTGSMESQPLHHQGVPESISASSRSVKWCQKAFGGYLL